MGFRNSVVLGSSIEYGGIIKILDKQCLPAKPDSGSEYYANAFLSLRKKDPLARVEIIPPSNPSDPKNSPLFQMTLSDGKQELLNPIEISWVYFNFEYRIFPGGYILNKYQKHYAESLLRAEKGEKPEMFTNSTFLRYSRDYEMLKRQGFPVMPEIGMLVRVMEHSNWKRHRQFVVLTADERHFPFEIAPDLISFEKWGVKPSGNKSGMIIDKSKMEMEVALWKKI